MSRREKKEHPVFYRVYRSLNKRRKRVNLTWPEAARKGIEAAEHEKQYVPKEKDTETAQ